MIKGINSLEPCLNHGRYANVNNLPSRNRHRELTYGCGERGGEGEMYGKSNKETYMTICKICCMAQETQTGAQYQSKGVGWDSR